MTNIVAPKKRTRGASDTKGKQPSGNIEDQLSIDCVWYSSYKFVCTQEDKILGVRFMNSEVGVALLSCINFLIKEYGVYKFNRLELFRFAETLSKKEVGTEYGDAIRESYASGSDKMVKLSTEEFHALFEATMFFDVEKRRVAAKADYFVVDPEILRDVVCRHVKQSSGVILLSHKREEDIVFKKPEVDLFYELLKEYFPAYHEVFKKLGIGEKYWDRKIKEASYKKAYKMVQGQVNFKMRAEMIKRGLGEGNLTAINAALRESAEIDPMRDIHKRKEVKAKAGFFGKKRGKLETEDLDMRSFKELREDVIEDLMPQQIETDASHETTSSTPRPLHPFRLYPKSCSSAQKS